MKKHLARHELNKVSCQKELSLHRRPDGVRAWEELNETDEETFFAQANGESMQDLQSIRMPRKSSRLIETMEEWVN